MLIDTSKGRGRKKLKLILSLITVYLAKLDHLQTVTRALVSALLQPKLKKQLGELFIKSHVDLGAFNYVELDKRGVGGKLNVYVCRLGLGALGGQKRAKICPLVYGEENWSKI